MRQQDPQQLDGGRGLAGDADPGPAQVRERPVGEDEHATRAGGAADAVGQGRQLGLDPEVVHQGERPRVELARGHGLPEPARDQVHELHAGEPVEERLAVEVRDAADAQHAQLHTFTTL